MEHLRFTEKPVLRTPILLAAFAGWNDAAGAATYALRYLLKQWSARRFGSIDPEEFYLFTEVRPTVRLIEGQQGAIEWPTNELFYHRDTLSGADFLALVGVEPGLRWRTFTDVVLELAHQQHVSTLVTLGSMLGEVPHTVPAKLVGSASDPEVREKLRRLGVQASGYEGTTGIVGVLHGRAAEEGLATISLWGNVPHYLPGIPIPKVSAALLRRLMALLDVIVDLTEIENLAITYDVHVAEAVAHHPDIAAYVRQLEERERQRASQAGDQPSGSPGLPGAEALMQELEEFLKRQRRGQQPP